jgi:hypothetical protein
VQEKTRVLEFFRVVTWRQEARIVSLELQQYTSFYLVYSNQLKWVPQGNQQAKKLKIALVHENILIAKLGENQ